MVITASTLKKIQDLILLFSSRTNNLFVTVLAISLSKWYANIVTTRSNPNS